MFMRSVVMSLLALSALVNSSSVHSSSAYGQLGHELQPSLGQTVPMPYESVVASDGSGLPSGSGSVSAGKIVFASRCAACHGISGEMLGNALVGGRDSLASSAPLRTVGSYWPYATTIFDYIQRAMPYGQEKLLSNDEVYAVTAYVLYLNGIVPIEADLSAVALAEIRMPNRDGFLTSPLNE